MRPVRPVVRVLLILALIFSSGCSSWKPIDATTAHVDSQPMTEVKLRVKNYEGTTIVLRNVQIRDGYLTGLRGRRSVTYPLEDVVSLEVKEFDDSMTILAVSGSMAGIMVGLGALSKVLAQAGGHLVLQ